MSESQNLNIFDQYLTPSNRGGLAPNHQASISRTLAMTVACMRILYRLSSCYGFEEIGIFIKNGQGPPQPPNGEWGTQIFRGCESGLSAPYAANMDALRRLLWLI